MNASYTTELVVELATISRVNISSDIPSDHTYFRILEFCLLQSSRDLGVILGILGIQNLRTNNLKIWDPEYVEFGNP